METRHRRQRLPATGTSLVLAVLVGCTAGSGEAAAGTYDEVVIVLPSWAGGQANAAVAGHILSEELDVPVVLRELDQPRAWDQLSEGSVQAILEDWGGVPDKENRYVVQHATVISAGELGPVGRVGWYVPDAYAGKHPEVTDWRGLNDHAESFASEETGESGRLLSGHPDDASHDDDLLAGLELDFTAEALGSEEQLIEALRRAARSGAPLLANLWQPHWLHEEVDLSEVRLPDYTPGCRQSEAPQPCGYPEIPLRKFLNTEFAEEGGTAAEFLTDFTWTAEEQNEVARLIEGEGMTPQGAARTWVEENPDRVADWLPQQP